MLKFPATENPPICLLGRKITFCSFRFVSFIREFPSFIFNPSYPAYQYLVTSETCSSLSYVNRYDKGLHRATYNLFVDEEWPHLISINPLFVREGTARFPLLYICAVFRISNCWVMDKLCFSLSPCQDRTDFKAWEQNSAFIGAY